MKNAHRSLPSPIDDQRTFKALHFPLEFITLDPGIFDQPGNAERFNILLMTCLFCNPLFSGNLGELLGGPWMLNKQLYGGFSMRHALMIVLCSLLLSSCGGGFYTLPPKEYRQQVRVLGVLPLMVDDSSTILHPERQEVLAVLHRQNAEKYQRLIEKLREKKGYFDVRAIEEFPDGLFSRLVASRTLTGEGSRLYRRYQFNPAATAELARDHVVDGLLVVIMNGLVRPEKRWDRSSLDYLEAEYNAVRVTAAVVLPNGETVWEFPGLAGGRFLPLQYPDFDEAYFNHSDEVAIHFITVPGLERTLAEKEKSLLGQEKHSAKYQELFNILAAELDPGIFSTQKEPVGK